MYTKNSKNTKFKRLSAYLPRNTETTQRYMNASVAYSTRTI